jgi:hypothetical protein
MGLPILSIEEHDRQVMNKPTDLNSYRDITRLGEQRHQEFTPPSSPLEAPNSEIPTPILLSQTNI